MSPERPSGVRGFSFKIDKPDTATRCCFVATLADAPAYLNVVFISAGGRRKNE